MKTIKILLTGTSIGFLASCSMMTTGSHKETGSSTSVSSERVGGNELSGGLPPSDDASKKCEKITRRLEFARSRNLDVSELEMQQFLACSSGNDLFAGSAIPPLDASSECQNISIMLQLEQLMNDSKTSQWEIGQLQQLVCVNPAPLFEMKWSSGVEVSNSDRYFYPNGKELNYGSTYYFFQWHHRDIR